MTVPSTNRGIFQDLKPTITTGFIYRSFGRILHLPVHVQHTDSQKKGHIRTLTENRSVTIVTTQLLYVPYKNEPDEKKLYAHSNIISTSEY